MLLYATFVDYITSSYFCHTGTSSTTYVSIQKQASITFVAVRFVAAAVLLRLVLVKQNFCILTLQGEKAEQYIL